MAVRRSGYWFTVVVIALALVAIFRGPGSSGCAIALHPGLASGGYPSTCVDLEVVDTPTGRELGLSGRQNIGVGTGMLFVFDSTERACIWMKDMEFPISIFWLNTDKRIIKAERSVSPETYPTTYCADDTKYVIELDPGTAFTAGLEVGQRLKL